MKRPARAGLFVFAFHVRPAVGHTAAKPLRNLAIYLFTAFLCLRLCIDVVFWDCVLPQDNEAHELGNVMKGFCSLASLGRFRIAISFGRRSRSRPYTKAPRR